MDRDEIIRISRLFAFSRLTNQDISKLLIEYCNVEHNKPLKETCTFISTLLQHSELLPLYIHKALEYYENKFTICKLYDIKQRKLLQIF